MDRVKIFADVQDLMRDILDDQMLVLAETTTVADVDGWDSMTHLQLVVAVEKHFKIKFGAKEILLWKDVGEMLDVIGSKVA